MAHKEIHVHASWAWKEKAGESTTKSRLDDTKDILDHVYFTSDYSVITHKTEFPVLDGPDTVGKLSDYNTFTKNNYDRTEDTKFFCWFVEGDFLDADGMAQVDGTCAICKGMDKVDEFADPDNTDRVWFQHHNAKGGYILGLFLQELGHTYGARHDDTRLDGWGDQLESGGYYTTPMLVSYIQDHQGDTGCEFIDHKNTNTGTYSPWAYAHCTENQFPAPIRGVSKDGDYKDGS